MLRNEMEFQDIKVKELALRTGISQRTLEGYIGVRGSIPPADVAVKIAKALNVSVEYLVTGESLNKTNKKNVNNMFEVFSSDKKILLKDIIDILEKFEIKKLQ
ncbi:helix-turn-helix transcriptional regulator [uncultured Treponema sp.]|uniref:helix-turn-helix domain-containing protein n=1 Tax=uncultured Treponema sp. TaxID=162155 RepID=UPI00258B2CA7|nr:helix-turn-helix transcriptional regulator [uncultured Treponema sp.]